MGYRWNRDRKGLSGNRQELVGQINIRTTAAQQAAYIAAGGASWLREQLDAEAARQACAPTAHNPFPTGPDRFTQNQCTITTRDFP